MKFLPLEWVRPHMIPMNILYYNPLSNGGSFEDPDILTIVYKDQDTNERFIYNIENPEIEIYITKPKFRTFDYMRDMTKINQCDKHIVPYKTRWSYAAKKLGLEKGDMAKSSPYVYNADIPIETYYLIQFLLEYPSGVAKSLSLGKLDIENDIIAIDGFPVAGETPINAVTYINMDTNDVYTLILVKDNIPIVPKGHPKYQEFEDLRNGFKVQADAVLDDPNIVLDKCHEKFDEMYPDMKYNIMYYTDELTMLKDLMFIIHSADNDYIGIWNMPYDMQNIMRRISVLGGDPFEIIPDPRFKVKRVFFKEDTNPIAHKRKHQCITSTVPSFVDDMVQYAGIRSGRGVIPSLKLNNVAKKELHDEKYDYSEVSDIKHLYYNDFVRFILYNIKDVLLLVGLERKTKDTSTIYSRMYQMAVFNNESFTTTKVVWNSLIKFMDGKNFVPGTNRNKGKHSKSIIDYSAALSNQLSMTENTEEQFDYELDEPDMNGDSEEGTEKEEKYQGAFVMNTLHMKPTGVKIMGKESKFIHDYVGDMDISSEYPSAILICNISNETLVAKVYLENPNDIDVKIPEGFVFRGDDRSSYKMDKSNYLLELYTEGDVFNFASQFLNLPSPEDILKDLKEIVNK